MKNQFSPEYLILHDYGGTPGAAPSFNPYHALVSGGRINYRDPKNPYGAPAPHAYKLNPKSIGLSWGGPVGGKPSKEEFALIKQEFDAIRRQFPNIKVMSHGEAFQQTRGTGQQASKLGRGLDEASWRKYLLEDLPYEPGTVTPAGPKPIGQRSLTAYAGVSQTQPSTKGAPTPMPSYKNVGGQTYMGPEASQQSRRLAEMLINQGTNQEPMTHWTQALGKVLMTGSGALRNDMAMNDVREGQAAGNQALASMLMGGDASAAMTNPYSQPQAMEYQTSQKMLADRNAAAERLKRMEIQANQSDPLYQARLRNIESEIKTREAGGVAGIKAAEKAATEADTKAQGKKALSDQLGSVVSSYLKLDQLGGVTNPDRGALENLGTSLGTSAAGQMFGKMTGSETQSIRERIVNARPLLIQGIRQATGMSARAMDSNRELDFYLQAASDPTKDIYSNLAAIDVLDRTYGLGNLLESMVQDGSLPKSTYDRVKQQASLAIQQRPIATEQPGATMPAIEVPQGGASNLKSKYGLE